LELRPDQQEELPMTRTITSVAAFMLGGLVTLQATDAARNQGSGDRQMELGNFSVSLAVKDIGASRAFYEKLGFRVFGGYQAHNWLILQNGTATVGLFQGMFDRNLMTFNPGWDRSGNALPDFDDIRDIQRTLKSRGLTLATAADEATTGPASLMVIDPDGNQILIDQHVPKPGK
jgi:catechol 2,3-dioxygenase-like lactoylglutathione lyase family enzyme